MTTVRPAPVAGPGARRRANPLGEFLRARRHATEPTATDVVADPRRRQVRGLRREEVADLAGISTDYYTRLEQGRERHPSRQVLDALARGLRLDADEAAHLVRLAVPGPSSAPATSSEVGADLRALLDRHALGVPAAVLGPAFDVLALNPLGAAFYGGFERTDNLLSMIFRDPAARDFYDDEWDLTARATVAGLRASAAMFPHHERIAVVVGELAAVSPFFAELWAAHPVALSPCPETRRMRHPVVGDLHLYCSTLAVVSCPGQILHLFTPDAGSVTSERLADLVAPGTGGAVGRG